jgi:hypothetical protein
MNRKTVSSVFNLNTKLNIYENKNVDLFIFHYINFLVYFKIV